MLRLVLVLALLAAVAAFALRPRVDAAPPSAPRFGVALDGRPITTARLDRLARTLGHRPGLVVVFEQWPENPPATASVAAPGLAGLADSLRAIAASGAVPVVTWEPMYYRQADGKEVILTADRILDGSYDAYFDAFAAMLAAQPGRVIVRLMHEPNLNRYHWGVDKPDYGPKAPVVYRELWRHIVGRVRAATAKAGAGGRVTFAFCVNAESVPGPGNTPGSEWNAISAYFPGAEWVDAVGVDGYNWGDTQTPARNGWQSSWRSFLSVLGPAVRELRTLVPGKPLHVFECASAATGGDKAEWLRETAVTARNWDLASLCWFEADKEVDWRLGSGVPAEAARQFVADLSASASGNR